MKEPEFYQFATQRQMVERVRLIGPTDDRQRVLLELYGNAFNVTFCGAYTEDQMFPFCDDSRFLIIAERVEVAHLASPVEECAADSGGAL